MKTNVYSQNWLALRRYGKLFRDLLPEEQEEILFDMEQEMIEGKNKVRFTETKMVSISQSKAGKEKDENRSDRETTRASEI